MVEPDPTWAAIWARARSPAADIPWESIAIGPCAGLSMASCGSG